jgi:DNA-binding CsgD family transcriptional regulator
VPAVPNDIISALRAVEECKSLEAIWRSLQAAVARMGLSLVIVTKGPQLSPFDREMAALGRLTPAELERLESDTATRRIVLRSHEPFLVHKSPNSRRLSSPEDWYALVCRLISAEAAFVIPLHREETVACIVAVAGRAAAFDVLTRSSLVVMAHAAFARAQHLQSPRNQRSVRPRLSAREIACLEGVAKKKSLGEIGRLLKISPRTVRFHLDNARTKLGVVTRAQAVQKALRQKLIRL